MSDDEEAWLEVYARDRYSDDHSIQWVFADDEGGTLGESIYKDSDLLKANPEDRDHVLACIVASKTEGVEHDSRGYKWPSAKKAKDALRAIKAALKADPGAAWPEWAVKAQAAGWKPPKGWKP